MSGHKNLYFGQLIVTKVENLYAEIYSQQENLTDKSSFTEKNIKSVHYPDCQQLIIWLPEYYTGYDRIEITDAFNEKLVYVAKIKDIISGSVQILLDTLFLYPGEFVLSIYNEDNVCYKVHLKKNHKGEQPLQNVQTPILKESSIDNDTIMYKDGFGNSLPDEDLILRDQVVKKTINKVFRRLEFISYGRDGEVVYIEGDKKIGFYMELGGNDCVFYLIVPPPEKWEAETKFPLSERDEILLYVAEGTLRDQAPNCMYRIAKREIYFYKN